ncbi:MAG: calcium-binding protein [Pseudomonadota bacterium]
MTIHTATEFDDFIKGTDESDAINAKAGEDTVLGKAGDDRINGGDDDDDLSGGQGDDVLIGARGNDLMEGNGGDDRMIWNNGDGSDIMNGGNGFDVAEVNGSDSDGDVFSIAVGGDRRVEFARTNFGPFTLDIGTTEALEVNGRGGDDVITAGEGLGDVIQLMLSGNAGDDHITGSDGADMINGGQGDDTLIGARGNDHIMGRAGDDLMIWNNGDGSDLMEGGGGYDTVQVNGATEAGDAFTIGIGEDGRIDFARTNLGLFALDIGSTEVLQVNAGGGDDVITAGEGLAGEISLQLFGNAGDDLIIGSDGEDMMSGGQGNDTLIGARGNDHIMGRAGDDLMIWNNGDGSDVMDGGSGYDTVRVNGSDSDGDVFEIGIGEDSRIDFARTNLGPFTLDIGSSEVLQVKGGGGDDVITASDGLAGEILLDLAGNAGNDVILGGDGGDRISGGGGNDAVTGGAGADVFVYRAGEDLITDFEQGADLVELGAALLGTESLQDSMAQVGDDVVLSLTSGSLTFADQTLADFTEDDFIFV